MMKLGRRFHVVQYNKGRMSKPVEIDKLVSLTRTRPVFEKETKLDLSKHIDSKYHRREGLVSGKSKSKAKQIYNDAMRESIDFGVTSHQVREYFDKRKSLLLDTLQDKNREVKQQELNKRKGIVFDPSDDAGSILSVVKEYQQDSEDENPFLDRKSITGETVFRSPPATPHPNSPKIRTSPSSQSVLRRQSSGIFRATLRRSSSSFKLRNRSSVSSQSSTPAPVQKECHSVEDTLLADEEFNDYSVPSARTSTRSSFNYDSSPNANRQSMIQKLRRESRPISEAIIPESDSFSFSYSKDSAENLNLAHPGG